MVRLGISVEGTTEERFVKQVLAPYLERVNIYITPISMNGAVSLDSVKSELTKMAFSFDYVTTLYDFYGFSRKKTGETKESLETRLYDVMHDGAKGKLIPYVQMYEFEGLLFSSPESMAHVLRDDGLVEWGNKVLDEFQHCPESINNSFETAPSKRLEQHTCYRKTTHGPNIAMDIGIDKIRSMCPEFNKWIAQLERLALPSNH